MRIGHGYDAHRTEIGRKLILGGIEIPSSFGLAAHSDGDVLTHAIIDALFGASGVGDIGQHFPDTDMKYKNCCSLDLLEDCVQEINTLGFRIVNIDATIIAQAPKIKPYIELIRKKLADACHISEAQINTKATTEERMGFTGSGEGISAHAVCLLEEIQK